jgi:hypothetical protein
MMRATKSRSAFCLIGLAALMILSQEDTKAQVTGSGTSNTIPKWTGSTSLGNSSIKETSGNVAIGGTPSTGFKFLIISSASSGSFRAHNTGSGDGVNADASSGVGVRASSTSSSGVRATSSSHSLHQAALFAISSTTNAIRAETSSTDGSAAAVFGLSFGAALAGRFSGNVTVSGTLSKGAGSFKIDHPLDPENKYLYHSFVESPDMKNIYDGNVVTDNKGEAVIEMPEYFETLNSDFRYQLTVLGTFAQAIVAEKIKGNRFVIRTSAPNVEVSWQVTGIRQDAFAKKNRIKVEVEKDERDRGYYLHPDAFNLPEERSISSRLGQKQ